MPFSGLLLMDIGGSEWVIIILVALVLIFGTKRLPQVSRTVGKAMGEYERARQQFRQEVQSATKMDISISKIPRITGAVATEREKLETMATSLGIDHAGKSDDELKTLISQRMNA
ncbi:MAG TPA: twin-arginine translocase TatA/TatE family subunit [Nitrososphaera sp.]|nr:twin-arginine translocase TatA/TatE family subunit [Nitrososphaera sp.]